MYAREPFRLAPLTTPSAPPCVYPVRVEGPVSFTLLAVWAWPAPTHKSAFLNGLDACADVPTPLVVAGDFHGNVCFDRPRGKKTWRSCVARLHDFGLLSAYHEHAMVEHRAEPAPTHYFQSKEDAPFHLDYCCVPREWLPRVTNVSIGNYADWADLSDHRPVTVDVTFA